MAALLTKSQFATLSEYANRKSSPFHHGPSRLITPTITEAHQGYLNSRLVRRKSSFQKINAKAKTIRPLYAAGVLVKKTIIPAIPSPAVQLVRKTPITVVVKKPQVKVEKPVDLGSIEPIKASLMRAMTMNGWFPENPPPMKKGWYMDPRELFYRVARCQFCGGINKAGKDGDRLIELFGLLAKNFMGRICFKDLGHMSNMGDDLIQEATTKCVLVVDRFEVWDTKETEAEVKINNAFAYFTTVSRNKMFETLTCPLTVSDVHLEDLKTDSQAIGDLV